jgi:hypothetical protein
MNCGLQGVKQKAVDGRAARNRVPGVNMNSGKSRVAPGTKLWQKDMNVKKLILSTIALLGLTAGAVAAPLPMLSPSLEIAGPGLIRVAQSSLPNTGVVKEVIDAGNYTYLNVEQEGAGLWLAIPRREVPVGATIHYYDGMAMKNFHSDTLNRDFEEVRFLGNVQVEGAAAPAGSAGNPATAALPPGHAPVPGMSGGPQEMPNAGIVKEAIPAGNYIYLRVEDAGKETWLALPKRDVPVGAKVRYVDGQMMKNFHSPSMNRDFDEVLFINGLEVVEN